MSAATSSGTHKTPTVGAASGKVTCTAPSLANGGKLGLRMVVEVTYKSGKTTTDTVSGSSPVFDATATNNSATATTSAN